MEQVWEVAKNMELEGEAYYKQLSEEAHIKELRGVFSFLAEQEKEHYNLFNSLQDDKTPSLADSENALKIAKEAFKKIVYDFSEQDAIESAEKKYQNAASVEKGAIEYYKSLLNKTENDDQKNALEKIIKEEKKHQVIMESLVDFIRRPNEWLENAEFNHLDDF